MLKAFHRSRSQYGARDELFTIAPSRPEFCIDNVTFLTNLQLCIGQPPTNAPSPTKCSSTHLYGPDQGCGRPVGSQLDYMHHSLSCTAQVKRTMNTRHNMIVQQACAILAHAGATGLVMEPKSILDNKARTTPDIEYAGFPTASNLFSTSGSLDVSVTHPAAPSYRKQAAIVALHAADTRDRVKNDKYLNKFKNQGRDFSPLVFETTGAWARSTTDFFLRLVRHTGLYGNGQPILSPAQTRSPLSTYNMPAGPGLLRFLRRVFAVVIARGNAHIITRALQQAPCAATCPPPMAADLSPSPPPLFLRED